MSGDTKPKRMHVVVRVAIAWVASIGVSFGVSALGAHTASGTFPMIFSIALIALALEVSFHNRRAVLAYIVVGVTLLATSPPLMASGFLIEPDDPEPKVRRSA